MKYLFYLWIMETKQSKSTTAKIRELRNLAILSAFKDRYVKGQQLTPLIEDIASEQDVKYSTAYKVIKQYRDELAVSTFGL